MMQRTTAIKTALKTMRDELESIRPMANAWDNDGLDHPGFKHASNKRKRLAQAIEILEQMIAKP